MDDNRDDADNVVELEKIRVIKALQLFSPDELRQLVIEIEQILFRPASGE